MRRLFSTAMLCGALLAGPGAQAAIVSMQGDMDTANPNDVVLITFSLAAAQGVTIQTWGYGGTAAAPGGVNAAGQVVAAGGFDPYVSLFLGTGASATFIASNDDGLCPPGDLAPACADSTLSFASLGPGDYTLALTLPFNFSYAENWGVGTLGDGFIGLDSSFDDGACGGTCSAHWAVDITSDAKPLPEPSTLSLLALALSALIPRPQVRRRRLGR